MFKLELQTNFSIAFILNLGEKLFAFWTNITKKCETKNKLSTFVR